MDAEKNKTLAQVHDAIDIVENERASDNLTPSERIQLERASVNLRNLERTINRMKLNELVASLTSDANALDHLANQMIQSAGKLAGVARTIQNAAGAIEAFIKIVNKATGSGLI